MDKSTYQALSSSVDSLQSRFNFMLHALQPDSAPSATSSSFSTDIRTNANIPTSSPSDLSTKEEEPENVLESLLEMITSMTSPAPQPLNITLPFSSTENQQTEGQKNNGSEE
jgi:hypothetical protein